MADSARLRKRCRTNCKVWKTRWSPLKRYNDIVVKKEVEIKSVLAIAELKLEITEFGPSLSLYSLFVFEPCAETYAE